MFDSIIIIVINGYEYHSIVSIHLSPHVHLGKNKVSVQTLQKPATEARLSSDLNPLFAGLCSVLETWVSA